MSLKLGPLRSIDAGLIAFALSAVVALSWLYLFQLAQDMDAMDMGGMEMGAMEMAHMRAWVLSDYVLMGIMWAVMMIGMMVPTALRAILIYARVAEQADAQGSPVAPTAWFVLGYILAWTGFSIAATGLQGALNQAGLLTPMMSSASPWLGAGLLLMAGVYQLTPWKNACLRHCQSPAEYLAGRFGRVPTTGIRLGINHGGYCVGCCWVLMGLLFLGGVMNLLWIAAITLYVLLEKLLPQRWQTASVSGWLMIGSALLYLAV